MIDDELKMTRESRTESNLLNSLKPISVFLKRANLIEIARGCPEHVLRVLEVNFLQICARHTRRLEE